MKLLPHFRRFLKFGGGVDIWTENDTAIIKAICTYLSNSASLKLPDFEAKFYINC